MNSNELASLFIDSGAGLVLSIWFILAVVLSSKNKLIVAKLAIWVWCGVATYNERTNPLHVYRHFSTNRLHGKAAELCLANS